MEKPLRHSMICRITTYYPNFTIVVKEQDIELSSATSRRLLPYPAVLGYNDRMPAYSGENDHLFRAMPFTQTG